MVSSLWDRVWPFLLKLNLFLPYNPAITFFGLFPKKVKIYVHLKTFTWMFILALFMIVKLESNEEVLHE